MSVEAEVCPTRCHECNYGGGKGTCTLWCSQYGYCGSTDADKEGTDCTKCFVEYVVVAGDDGHKYSSCADAGFVDVPCEEQCGLAASHLGIEGTTPTLFGNPILPSRCQTTDGKLFWDGPAIATGGEFCGQNNRPCICQYTLDVYGDDVIYYPLTGGCRGDKDLNEYTSISQEKCQEHCSNNKDCVGIEYRAGDATCWTKYDYCGAWQGLCTDDYCFFKKQSKKRCDSLCDNTGGNCKQWADENQCLANPNYMKQCCKEACGYCPDDIEWDYISCFADAHALSEFESDPSDGSYTVQWCAIECESKKLAYFGLSDRNGIKVCQCGKDVDQSKRVNDRLCNYGKMGGPSGTSVYGFKGKACMAVPSIKKMVQDGGMIADSARSFRVSNTVCCGAGVNSCGIYTNDISIEQSTTLTHEGSLSVGESDTVEVKCEFDGVGAATDNTFSVDATLTWGKASTETKKISVQPQCENPTDPTSSHLLDFICTSVMYKVKVNMYMEACGQTYEVKGELSQNTLETYCTCRVDNCMCEVENPDEKATCLNNNWGVSCGYQDPDYPSKIFRANSCNLCPQKFNSPSDYCKGDCSWNGASCVFNSCSGNPCPDPPSQCVKKGDKCHDGITCPTFTYQPNGHYCTDVPGKTGNQYGICQSGKCVLVANKHKKDDQDAALGDKTRAPVQDKKKLLPCKVAEQEETYTLCTAKVSGIDWVCYDQNGKEYMQKKDTGKDIDCSGKPCYDWQTKLLGTCESNADSSDSSSSDSDSNDAMIYNAIAGVDNRLIRLFAGIGVIVMLFSGIQHARKRFAADYTKIEEEI